MSTLHTPGPWDHSNGKVFGPTGTAILTVHKHTSPTVTLANIALASAAPDLLTELRKARAALQDSLDSLIESHTNPETGLITNDADMLAIESEQDLINGIDAAIAKATGEQP